MCEDKERGVEAVLRFPLPECQGEFENAVKGVDWQMAMWELLETNLHRKVTKGEHDFETPEEVLEFVWKKAWEILDDHDLKFS